MRMWLVFLAFIFFTASARPGFAQGEIKLESVHIELLSEYDQPSMLVINEFVVSRATPLPVKVVMRYPSQGNLVAVAYEINGALFNTQFESPAEQGNWQTITLNVESYVPYRIEYYQPLTREGNRRSFDFQWFGDYSINEFSFSVVLPADSTDLNTSPELSKIVLDPDGKVLVGTNSENNLKMGHSYPFALEYERPSDELVDPDQANQVQPSEPIEPDTPGRVSVENLPWVIGLVGIALIGFALFFYWRSNQTGAFSSRDNGTRRRRRSSAGEEKERQVYCHECGARSYPSDQYCRNCGSRLRVE